MRRDKIERLIAFHCVVVCCVFIWLCFVYTHLHPTHKHCSSFDVLLCFSIGMQSRGTLRRRIGKKLLSHHLYFCMRDFGYSIGDDAEVFFYLFDGSPGAMRQVSERFSVFIPKDGYNEFHEKIHTNCCVFTDLGKK